MLAGLKVVYRLGKEQVKRLKETSRRAYSLLPTLALPPTQVIVRFPFPVSAIYVPKLPLALCYLCR